MKKDLSDFVCKICNKSYSSYQSLWNHNKKFHKMDVSHISPNVNHISPNVSHISPNINIDLKIKNIQYEIKCKFCNSSFKHRSSKSKHEKICKTKVNSLTETDKLKNELIEIKEQLSNLLKSTKMHPKTFQKINNRLINNNTTNNTNNTINNTINNNNINITYVKFGDEKLSEILTDDDMLKILFECRFGVNKSIELTHFNDKRPELKNIIITNLQNNIGYVFNGEKFEAKPKDDILGDLFDKHLINIENYINESDILQTKIQNNTVLDKIVNYRFPKFIEDLNNDKYRIEKINELKLLTYNKSDSKALRIN